MFVVDLFPTEWDDFVAIESLLLFQYYPLKKKDTQSVSPMQNHSHASCTY